MIFYFEESSESGFLFFGSVFSCSKWKDWLICADSILTRSGNAFEYFFNALNRSSTLLDINDCAKQLIFQHFFQSIHLKDG